MTAIPGPGVRAIAEERVRQITEEGWSAEHDDAHDRGELTAAATNYLIYAGRQILGFEPVDVGMPPESYYGWPWDPEWWKPADNPLRNLEKAGALIAAEIDRLIAARERSAGPMHAFAGYDANPDICRVCGGVRVMAGVVSCRRVRGVDA